MTTAITSFRNLKSRSEVADLHERWRFVRNSDKLVEVKKHWDEAIGLWEEANGKLDKIFHDIHDLDSELPGEIKRELNQLTVTHLIITDTIETEAMRWEDPELAEKARAVAQYFELWRTNYCSIPKPLTPESAAKLAMLLGDAN